MKDSDDNKIIIGTKLRSTSKHNRKEIVCISLNKEFGMFKALRRFREKAIPVKMTNGEMSESTWVDAEKLKDDE